MDCNDGRSNHYNIQYHENTSNHKWTVIKWISPYCNGL